MVFFLVQSAEKKYFVRIIWYFSKNNTKYKNCQFRKAVSLTLQYFATKLCNFITFRMLFQAVTMRFRISKFFKF
jgi:hypothetical protein